VIVGPRRVAMTAKIDGENMVLLSEQPRERQVGLPTEPRGVTDEQRRAPASEIVDHEATASHTRIIPLAHPFTVTFGGPGPCTSTRLRIRVVQQAAAQLSPGLAEPKDGVTASGRRLPTC
jgi:hypothetical protein